MKKSIVIALSLLAIFGGLRAIDALAAAFPPALGGTGTTATPQPGQVLIGNGSASYTPAYILCAGTCSVSTASGTITITGTGVATNTGNWAGTWQAYNPHDFVPSSTAIVNTVNGSSGTVTITSSTLGVVWPTINGNKSAAYQILPGTGVTSTVNGATTTISVSLNNGSTQSCSANQFINSVTSSGIVSCGSITFPTPATYTFVAGAGLSVSQSTSTSNTTTTYTNTGVTSFNTQTGAATYTEHAGAGIAVTTSTASSTITNTGVTSFTGTGCVTAANSTGTVGLTVTCISGNQSITFTISGDATGTANGTTSITDNITVTGLDGHALPAVASGTLQYTSGAWKINLATSSLGVYDANGNLSSFGGSTCSGGQFQNGISTAGMALCATPSGGSFTTTTINGQAALVFHLIGDGTTVTSTVSGATTTYSVVPGVYLTPASGTAMFYPLNSNPAGYVTSTGSSATGTAFYFPFWNASGTALSPTSSITVSSTSGNVGIDTTNTPQNLTVSGNAQITAADGSKEYRFRTTGLAMDWEGSNAPLDFSVWSGNNFSGTQEDYFSAQGSSHAIYNAGNWYWQDGNDVFGHGNNPVFTILGDPNGGVVVGASTSSAMLGVVSNQTTTASFVRSGTATTTVIQGSASSTACSTFYTPSGTAIYSTYLATGQILTSTSSCQ